MKLYVSQSFLSTFLPYLHYFTDYKPSVFRRINTLPLSLWCSYTVFFLRCSAVYVGYQTCESNLVYLPLWLYQSLALTLSVICFIPLEHREYWKFSCLPHVLVINIDPCNSWIFFYYILTRAHRSPNTYDTLCLSGLIYLHSEHISETYPLQYSRIP